MLRNFAYIRPTSLTDAVKQIASSGARLHAGGTDLIGCLRDEVFDADRIVSLSRLTDLRGIAASPDGGLRIGALTTIAEIAASPLVDEKAHVLAMAAHDVASPQLRNQGTLGGNLCQRPRCWFFRGGYPCLRKGGDTCFAIAGDNRYHAVFGGGACYMVHPSDTAPALVALDAQVVIAGPKGTRAVPIEKFFVTPAQAVTRENVLEPGEILTEVQVPPIAGAKSVYRKVRARGAWDFALASLAASLVMKGDKVERGRLVFGGAAPVPWRLVDAEKLLAGQKLDAKTIEKVAAAAVKGTAPLQHNGYKVAMLRGIVEEVLGGLA